MLDLEIFAGIKRRAVAGETPFPVIGVHTIDPSVVEFLLQRAAHKIQPGLIEKGEHLVWAGNPHHHWCGVRHIPEAPFTLRYRSFALLAIGDIETDARHAYRPAGGV